MNKVTKNVVSGLYFVASAGFTGNASTATRFSDSYAAQSNVDCAKSMGITAVIENAQESSCPAIKQNSDGSSYATSFIRTKSLRSDGTVASHKLNPSKRRFRTMAEAVKHGSRFMLIEKHLGFYVTKTHDPVNAYVSAVTGFTNPEVGKKRLGNQAGRQAVA